jgi:3-deoxy-D-manno-octulosonate 8-phosphate phosphatase (KDO 8-P phosphatase)
MQCYHRPVPSRLPPDVRRKLEPIRLLVLDVDGVLTDGTLLYTERGEEIKVFHVRDGLGVRLLQRCGIDVAVITGRSAAAVRTRCRDLGLADEDIVLGSRDKLADLSALTARLDLDHRQVAVMGDDLQDLPMLARAGFAVCPADAVPEVAAACDLVCGTPGGRGAVREVAELLLKAAGRWSEVVEAFAGPRGEPR